MRSPVGSSVPQGKRSGIRGPCGRRQPGSKRGTAPVPRDEAQCGRPGEEQHRTEPDQPDRRARVPALRAAGDRDGAGRVRWLIRDGRRRRIRRFGRARWRRRWWLAAGLLGLAFDDLVCGAGRRVVGRGDGMGAGAAVGARRRGRVQRGGAAASGSRRCGLTERRTVPVECDLTWRAGGGLPVRLDGRPSVGGRELGTRAPCARADYQARVPGRVRGLVVDCHASADDASREEQASRQAAQHVHPWRMSDGWRSGGAACDLEDAHHFSQQLPGELR